jgi:hypothetical protein
MTRALKMLDPNNLRPRTENRKVLDTQGPRTENRKVLDTRWT